MPESHDAPYLPLSTSFKGGGPKWPRPIDLAMPLPPDMLKAPLKIDTEGSERGWEAPTAIEFDSPQQDQSLR